jgi:hypothetical protein
MSLPGQTAFELIHSGSLDLQTIQDLERRGSRGEFAALLEAKARRHLHEQDSRALRDRSLIAVPRWATRPPGPKGETKTLVLTYGWPMRCLGSESLVYYKLGMGGAAARLERRWMWQVIDVPSLGSGYLVGLPLRPMPLGLAINTALFGSAWFAVLMGLPAARRWTRRRRGACPACGYDLRTDPAGGCPECGRGRKSA